VKILVDDDRLLLTFGKDASPLATRLTATDGASGI
jgi:hypothetical protein